MQPGSRRRRAAQCLHLEAGSGPAHALQLSLPTRLREAESAAPRTVPAPAAAPSQPTGSRYNSGRLGPGDRPPRLPPAGGHLSATGVSHLFFTIAAYCHKTEFCVLRQMPIEMHCHI
ncbi:hypothetical protein KIL84_000994 [Mauremys mutica]|uniref:Uncharacterized protein n=1 Tax=Mauremys mutica TaxID=74926 RepID=A0A9D4ATN9_9SAUR|nr:hypothetical protein KIL84_000994 [Mauremys mutica]